MSSGLYPWTCPMGQLVSSSPPRLHRPRGPCTSFIHFMSERTPWRCRACHALVGGWEAVCVGSRVCREAVVQGGRIPTPALLPTLHPGRRVVAGCWEGHLGMLSPRVCIIPMISQGTREQKWRGGVAAGAAEGPVPVEVSVSCLPSWWWRPVLVSWVPLSICQISTPQSLSSHLGSSSPPNPEVGFTQVGVTQGLRQQGWEDRTEFCGPTGSC